MEQKLQLVILDNNGTMLDDFEIAYGSVQSIFSIFNLRCPTKRQYRNEITADFMEFYWHYGIPRDTTGDQLNAVRKLFYRARRSKARFRPGLKTFLQQCRRIGVRAAVCSAEIDAVLKEYLDLADLDEFFACVRGSAWPRKTAALELIMKQLPIAPQATAFVSDTVEDLVDAKVAGITTIALVHPTSYNSAAKFRKYGPDYTVHDFRALRRLVIELAK